MEEKKRETHAIVLDFLQNGYPFDKRPSHLKTPIGQSVGLTKFALLELVPKKDIHLQPLERVSLTDKDNGKIEKVTGRIGMRKLTHTARSELPHVLRTILKERETEFVNFFNTAGPLSTRMHILEILPGIGKRHKQEIIDAREKAPFTSFEDIKKRVKLLSDPQKVLIARIMNEIEGKEKHNLFVK